MPEQVPTYGGPTYSQQPGWGQGPTVEYGGTNAPTSWNPQGRYTDPLGYKVPQKRFAPHLFMRQLTDSPEARDYMDVEGAARTSGVQGIRGGEAAATDEARQEAANQGLGRGFAAQQQTDIRQQGTMGVSDMMVQANLEGRSRRFEMASQMTQSLIEAHKYKAYYYLARKTMKAGAKAGRLSFLGDIGGALLGAGGSIAGGAIAACWIAEAIFGKHDMNTHLARHWVTNKAPRWFYWAYRIVGKKVAKLVEKSDTLKNLLRPIFLKFAEWGADAILEEHDAA